MSSAAPPRGRAVDRRERLRSGSCTRDACGARTPMLTAGLMHTPPLPGIVESLLTIAARLQFRSTNRDPSGSIELGKLSDGTKDWHLFIASGGMDGTWVLADTLPEGFYSVLLSAATYDVLHNGQLSSNGAILYREQCYRLRVWYDGANLTAQAMKV